MNPNIMKGIKSLLRTFLSLNMPMCVYVDMYIHDTFKM